MFTLKSTNIATPLPVNKPDIIAPNDITFSKYSCVITTLEAQFGINPIKLDKIGPNTFFLNIKFPNVSSPT